MTLRMQDIGFIALLAQTGSLSAAARESKVSVAAVSKHLSAIEKRLGAALVNRSTRRLSLTAEGGLCVSRGKVLLQSLEELSAAISGSTAAPSGLLRVNTTLGFGRSHVSAAVAEFSKLFPAVQVRLQLSVDPPALTQDAFDVCIRFGAPPDARVPAQLVARNERWICASPQYLAKYGTPQTPAALTEHDLIAIRQGEDAYGVLKLTHRQSGKTSAVKMHSRLTTNDGGVAVQWALAGLGLIHRAQWDVVQHLSSGKLQRVLPEFATPNADIYAISPPQHHQTARVRAFITHLKAAWATRMTLEKPTQGQAWSI